MEPDINAINDTPLLLGRHVLLVVFHINAQSIDYPPPDFCIISSYFLTHGNVLSFYEHLKGSVVHVISEDKNCKIIGLRGNEIWQL